MRYELLRPHQVAEAIAANLPFVLPIGVMEHHGGHLPAGVDLLAVTGVLARLGDEIVLLPPFAYGAASHAVAGPEHGTTLHVDASALVPFFEGLCTALLRAGLRNVHGVIHHQTENFVQGMPTDLAFRLAARNAIFRFLEAERGPGWWGRREMRDYYSQHEAGQDPFNWIRLHPLFPKNDILPFDHAGEGETALMLALAHESVAIERADEGNPWWSETAPRASTAMGEEGVALALAHLRQVLGLGPGG